MEEEGEEDEEDEEGEGKEEATGEEAQGKELRDKAGYRTRRMVQMRYSRYSRRCSSSPCSWMF